MALRRREAIGAVLLALGGLWGCASAESDEYPSNPDYMFGGQTGSLIPGCGVAPLSRDGQALPAGDAIAVVYTRDCRLAAVDDLVSVSAPDASSVNVQLEPLGESGAYLVRADMALAAGDYRVQLDGGASTTLQVAPDAAPLPTRLGSIESGAMEEACGDSIELQLELDAAALAYAPLLRLYARIDAGLEQVLVDYGALELREGSSAARLSLPRCGSVCLGEGEHEIELRGEIAGEDTDMPSIVSSFDNGCAEGGDASCTLSPRRGSYDGMLALLLISLLPSLRRAARELIPRLPRNR